jgi:hypothetical protein
MCRHRLVLLFALVVGPTWAGQPAQLEPIPEPPPPPPGYLLDSAMEPQVTISKRGDDQVEEFRIRGKLYMVRVTPPHGTAYYLVDNQGDGQFTRMEIAASNLKVPMWVLKTW